MNLDTETWDVISSYFRDIPNYLVRHHIDSYNDFIQNKIPLIFKNFDKNPQTKIILIDKDDKTIVYEIKIYYGGKNHDKYKIAKPTIKTYPSGEIRQLYPNEARLKNLTYGADFFYSIEIELTMRKNNTIIFENKPIPNSSYLENIYLGKIPIMLKSDLCVLNEASSEMLTQMGEDAYDLGGYFILDGAEKTIVSQERKAENIIFLNTVTQSTGVEKYTHFAEVKCVSDEAFANAKTVKVQLESTGSITVRLGQKKAFLIENKKRDVPLFIMFRALGIESDKEILNYIIGNTNRNSDLTTKMMELLRPSILDPFIIEDQIYDRERAESYLAELPSRAQNDSSINIENSNIPDYMSEITKSKSTKLSFLYNTFTEAFYPHITTSGNINKAKAYYLGFVVRKLLLLKMGLEKDTDRDNFINKRIDLSGFLISTLFRDAFQQVIRNVRVQTNREYTFNYKEYSGANIIYLINESNHKKIFTRDSLLREVFKDHFNNQLKIGNIGQKIGVVQALDRGSRNLTIAHLRRIIDNIAAGQRVTVARRRLHASQYGCVCPSETPEGAKVGLNKGLAIISHITFGCPTKPIIDFCIEQGTDMLDDFLPIEIGNLCKIFVNGNWIGCHRNPATLVNIFRLYRRNGLINIFTSITWDCSNNDIKIYTDGGRFVRPLYIINHNNILIQPKHISAILTNEYTFTDLVSGFRKRKDKYNYYNCKVNNLESIGIINITHSQLQNSPNLQFNPIIEKLYEEQAVIEYIDCQEFDTSLLSFGFTISHKSLLNYTHAELHPSMALSFNAHLLPFIQYNAGPRVIMSSKHVKQGITTYAMNFNNRIDTSSIVLNSPEKSLVTCRLNNVLGVDKFGQGHNLFVAVSKYNYNQEDAIVGNQSAIDMGLFGTSYYKQYSDIEKTDIKTGEEHHFYNPDLQYAEEMTDYPDSSLLASKSRKDYSKIDKYGLPKKGVFLEKDDIVIGKYMKGKDERGTDVFVDISTDVKLGNEGSIVDKVFTCQTNEEGDRMVKVRTCQHRPPVLGDKFASRNCQKGTFGLVMKKEDMPYTEDGIVPDIILDPASYPSRMTIPQLIEILFGNLAAELGFFGCYNAFEPVNIEQINDILEHKLGLTSMGNRVLYNGMNGQQMEVSIFSGVIYYQRLKYMVDDKINTREGGRRDNQGVTVPGGAYTVKERQSVAGRANGGGLRIGEMERDVLLAHGVWGFIKESFIERCDKFIIQVSKASGEISICNPETGLYYDNITDGTTSFQLNDVVNKKYLTPDKIIGLNMYNQKTMDYVQLVVPYTFKLLIQEMQGMCINVRMNVDYMKKIILQTEETDSIIELTDDDIDNMLTQNEDGDDAEQDDGADDGADEEQEGGFNNNDVIVEDEADVEADVEASISSLQNTDNTDNTDNTYNTNELFIASSQRPNLNPGINNMQNMQGGHHNMQGGHHNMQGGMQNMQMEVHMDKTNNNDTDHIDLSHYGGTKPEFYVKEKDDNQVIEDMNSKLLGLHNGGDRDTLDIAKANGINNILTSTQQKPIYQQNMIQQHNNHSGGMNMSYGGQQPIQQQNMMQHQQPMQQQNMMHQQQQQPMQGGYNTNSANNISFDSNIKVVELDAKITDGFFYGGSKNLDPFRK